MRTAPRDILPGRNEGEFRSWRPLPPTSAEGKDPSIILIEKRVLIRDCLTQCLRLSSEPNVIPFPSVEKWLEAADKTPAALIVFCIAGKSNDPRTHREIALLSQMEQHVPTVLSSDTEISITSLMRSIRVPGVIYPRIYRLRLRSKPCAS